MSEETSYGSLVHQANGIFLGKKIHFGSVFCNQFFCAKQSPSDRFCNPEGASLFFPVIRNHLGPVFNILNSPPERITPSPTGHSIWALWCSLFSERFSFRCILCYFCILGQTAFKMFLSHSIVCLPEASTWRQQPVTGVWLTSLGWV